MANDGKAAGENNEGAEQRPVSRGVLLRKTAGKRSRRWRRKSSPESLVGFDA